MFVDVLPEDCIPVLVHLLAGDGGQRKRGVFNDTVRTVIYVASLAASIVGLGFMMFGDAQVGGFISTAAGVVASGFGVAYNPLRNA